MNAFVVAATILLAALAPLAVVASVRRPIDGLVALELAGVLTTAALLCLAVGLHQSAFFDVAVVSAVATWIGGLVVARFLGRWV